MKDFVIIVNSCDKFEWLNPVLQNQRYKISCQAALLGKEILLKYLRPYEST